MHVQMAIMTKEKIAFLAPLFVEVEIAFRIQILVLMVYLGHFNLEIGLILFQTIDLVQE